MGTEINFVDGSMNAYEVVLVLVLIFSFTSFCIYSLCSIFDRLGYTGKTRIFLILLSFVCGGLLVVIYLALCDWPIEKELKSLRENKKEDIFSESNPES
jgi:hypothetical protein